MPFVTRKSLLTLSILSGVALVAAAGFVWSGVYNIGADDTHTRPVYSTLQALRERSIEVRANKLQRPADLSQARTMVGESVRLYNERRPHLSLKYKTPDAVHRASVANQLGLEISRE